MVEIFYGIFLFLFILTNAKNKTMQHTPISFTKLHKFTHDKIIPKFAEHLLDRVQVVREAAGIQ
jgi:hypothetical protein